MRTPLGAFIIVVIMILLDIYVFMAIKTVSHSASSKNQDNYLFRLLGHFNIGVIGFLIFVFTGPEFLPKKVRTYLFATVIGLFLAQFVAVFFFW